jgi:hypothetical protein
VDVTREAAKRGEGDKWGGGERRKRQAGRRGRRRIKRDRCHNNGGSVSSPPLLGIAIGRNIERMEYQEHVWKKGLNMGGRKEGKHIEEGGKRRNKMNGREKERKERERERRPHRPTA